jgi:hypothetical protein
MIQQSKLTEYHLPKKKKTYEDIEPFPDTDVLKDPAASNFSIQVAMKTTSEVLMFSLFAVH